jgi:hypothetical protein
MVGGSQGVVVASTFFMNFQSMSQVGFAFAVTAAPVVQRMAYAVAMGLIGADAASWRAAALHRDGSTRRLGRVKGDE